MMDTAMLVCVVIQKHYDRAREVLPLSHCFVKAVLEVWTHWFICATHELPIAAHESCASALLEFYPPILFLPSIS